MLLSNFSPLELARLDALIAALASLLTCLLLVSTKKWHGVFSMDTSIGVQKFHTTPTPRIAGIALVVGVLAGYAFSSQSPEAAEKRQILSTILMAGMPAFIFGLLEDITKKVSVNTRLLATMASGFLGWGITGTSLNSISIWGFDWLLSFSIVSVIFTIFAVSGIANAINIIDGFNGLTAGVALIMLSALGIIAREVGDIPLAFTCLVIAGAVIGFFLVNWPLGKIFLGDGGAYFLGFSLAWLAILLPERNPQVSPWASLLICSYPFIEVIFSIYRRKFLRKKFHATQADAFHLHSLTNKRWVRHFFRNSSPTLKNGLTSPFIWFYSAIPCTLAILFFEENLNCILSFIFFTLIYLLIYSKLAFFSWIPRR
jgi:UDP-N-acetylmuramyl pentapeptide phosphotransferase/UDP-N-acetylglucosamine-1-phosphate transferase